MVRGGGGKLGLNAKHKGRPGGGGASVRLPEGAERLYRVSGEQTRDVAALAWCQSQITPEPGGSPDGPAKMTSLLVEWVNDELQLEPPLTEETLAEELGSGFILGALLHRHNQLADHERLRRRDTADARIENFCVLEPTLASLGVRFDANAALGVMSCLDMRAEQALQCVDLEEVEILSVGSAVWVEGNAFLSRNASVALDRAVYTKILIYACVLLVF